MREFFTSFNRFAIVGLSRDAKAFSRNVCQFLAQRGCELFVVNPNADAIAGYQCYRTPAELPDVDGAIFFTKPDITVSLLPDCSARGISRVWFQQGSADKDVLNLAEELGMDYMNACAFMYNPGAGFPHSFHTYLAKLFNKY